MNGVASSRRPSSRATSASSTAPTSSPAAISIAPNSTSAGQACGPVCCESSCWTDSASSCCSWVSSKSTSLLGKPEDPVSHDVALDLLRPAELCRRAREQVGLVPMTVVYIGSWRQEAFTEHVECRRGRGLLGLGHEELDARARGANRLAVEKPPDRAGRMVAQHLDGDERARQRYLDVFSFCDRPSVDRARAGIGGQPVHPGPELHLPRKGGGAAFVSGRVQGDRPPLAARAEKVLLRHDDIVEEELGEFCMAGDLRHGPDLDP